MPNLMHDHLTALLDAGYSVTVEPDLEAAKGLGPRQYFAHVEMDGQPDLGCTAGGASPAEAIWAASPLHDDDEKMPALLNLMAEESDDFKEITADLREVAALKLGELNKDVDTLNGDMTDVLDRLDEVEDKYTRDMSVMIRLAGDLFTRAFPGGLLATRGDGPAPGMPSPGEGIPLCGKCGRYPVDHRGGECVYPLGCRCGHPAEVHWEVAEPDGERKGCSHLGCPCPRHVPNA